MAHRGLEKIYRNTQITEGQKDLLIEKIASKIPDQKGKIINSYLFLKLFMPIGEEILAKMADRITRNFPDSLSVFYFCFGEFVDVYKRQVLSELGRRWNAAALIITTSICS